MVDINFIEIQYIQIPEQGLKQHGLIAKLALLWLCHWMNDLTYLFQPNWLFYDSIKCLKKPHKKIFTDV